MQIVHSSWRRSRDIEHIGSAHAEAELAAPPHPPATPVRTNLSQVGARYARNRRLADAVQQWAFCALRGSPGPAPTTTRCGPGASATRPPCANSATVWSASSTAASIVEQVDGRDRTFYRLVHTHCGRRLAADPAAHQQ